MSRHSHARAEGIEDVGRFRQDVGADLSQLSGTLEMVLSSQLQQDGPNEELRAATRERSLDETIELMIQLEEIEVELAEAEWFGAGAFRQIISNFHQEIADEAFWMAVEEAEDAERGEPA